MDKLGPIINGVASLLLGIGVVVVLFKTSGLIATLSKWLGVEKEPKH